MLKKGYFLKIIVLKRYVTIVNQRGLDDKTVGKTDHVTPYINYYLLPRIMWFKPNRRYMKWKT